MRGHAGFEKPQDCSVTVTLLDAGGVEILSLIHQPCRKFINITGNAVTVLPNQHNSVSFFPIKRVNNDPVCFVYSGRQLQLFDAAGTGSDVIESRLSRTMYDIQIKHIEKTIICNLCDLPDTAHSFSSFPGNPYRNPIEFLSFT